jgi:hypothetical protein
MVRSKNVLWLTLFALTFIAAVTPLHAQCTVSRSQIEAELAAGATGDDLYTKYGNCTASSTAMVAPASGITAITDEANTFVNFNINWERIESCGYHPQREEADCAIEIRQNGGYGGPICAAGGSHEWVMLCVNFGAGLVPVGTGEVHVHDAPAGAVAPWDFGVVVQGAPRLTGLLNNGATLPARAILSWAIIPPANCNWAPVWGNWANFRLRLDP